jgi:hypothetical protein
MPLDAASASSFATSSVDAGNATISGAHRKLVSPSHSYVRSSDGSVMQYAGPTISRTRGARSRTVRFAIVSPASSQMDAGQSRRRPMSNGAAADSRSTLSRSKPCRDFDLDAHAGVEQSGNDHGRGRRSGPEGPAKHGPARFEVGAGRNDIADSYDIAEPGTSVAERDLDVGKSLLALLHGVFRERHRRVVEARGAGDEHPVSRNDGPRIADALFEDGARRNALALGRHAWPPTSPARGNQAKPTKPVQRRWKTGAGRGTHAGVSQRAHILEWYRANSAGPLLRILVSGAAAMLLAAVVIAASFLTRQPERVRACSAATGLVLAVCSGAFTHFSMVRMLSRDASLAIRTDGICLQAQGTESVLAWDEIVRAGWDAARRRLVIERAEADPVVVAWVPAGISGPDLAVRIERQRKRVAMGLPSGPG